MNEMKLRRYAAAPKVLTHLGIPFTIHNNGAHYRLYDRVDFWPGTLRWGIDGKIRQGLAPMLKRLGVR